MTFNPFSRLLQGNAFQVDGDDYMESLDGGCLKKNNLLSLENIEI